MQIILTESLQRDVETLSEAQREQLFDVILHLPKALKEPLKHSGLGLRKIHPSGIFEARIGLGLRLIFGLASHSAILHHVGSHDEIQRYLKNL